MLSSDCKQSKRDLDIEIARSDLGRQKGLSDRKTQLKKNEGMLFVFDQPEVVGFWMKRTFIPLQLLFVDSESKTFGSVEMPVEPNPDSPVKIYRSSRSVVAALELKTHSIKNANYLKLCVQTDPGKDQVKAPSAP